MVALGRRRVRRDPLVSGLAPEVEVVFIPGLNNSSASWLPTVRALPTGIHGISVDCPPISDIDELAADLLTGLPERFVVVGHSFGGYVALTMLATHPERIEGIVLVNSGTGSDTDAAAAGRLEKAEQAASGGYEALANAASARAYHPSNAGDPAIMAARASGIREYGAERYAAHQKASAARPDRTEVLSRAKIPKLVVSADEDLVVPTAKQEAMAEAVGAPQQVIPQTGHMLPAEAPEQLARVIADFVTAQVASAEPSQRQGANR